MARSSSALASAPSVAATRRAYLDLIVVGYLLYGVGAISPYLRERLALSDTQTGLHSSALAAGIITIGLVGDRLDRRWGSDRAGAAAIAAMAVACFLLAWAPALPVTLLAAVAIGLGTGLMLGHVNATLAAGGGPGSRLRLTRANLLSILAAQAAPLVIAAALGLGLEWQAALGPALLGLGVAFRGTRHRADVPAGPRVHDTARLPRAYWLAWCYVVLVVAVEFASVFWGATLVQRQAGTSLPEATLIGAAFLFGMVAGRLALSVPGLSGALESRSLARIGLVVAGVGLTVAWSSTSAPLGAIGLFIGGLGVSALYPLGVALALAAGASHPDTAAARLTMASGIAILTAPLVLGLLADAVGVVAGWTIVPALCLTALLVVALPGPAADARRAGRSEATP